MDMHQIWKDSYQELKWTTTAYTDCKWTTTDYTDCSSTWGQIPEPQNTVWYLRVYTFLWQKMTTVVISAP